MIAETRFLASKGTRSESPDREHGRVVKRVVNRYVATQKVVAKEFDKGGEDRQKFTV